LSGSISQLLKSNFGHSNNTNNTNNAKSPSFALGDNQWVLYLTAPRVLEQEGVIEVLSEDGSILFSKEIQGENTNLGKLFAARLSSNFWNDLPMENQSHVLFYSREFQNLLLNPNKKSGFRFCWKKVERNYFSNYCTPYYRYSSKENQIVIQTQVAPSKAFLNHVEVEKKGVIPLRPHQEVRFLVKNLQGFSIEFYSRVPSLELTDFYDSDNKSQYILLFGHSQHPVSSPVKLFPFSPKSSSYPLINWDSTIGDTKDYWVTSIKKNDSSLILPGAGGGLFLFPIEVGIPPLKLHKLNLVEPLTSTYSSHPMIQGLLPSRLELQAIAPGKMNVLKNSTSFQWEIQTPESASINKADLIITDKSQDQAQSYTATYALYRGYSSEFSLRLAGSISTDGKLDYLGEVAYNQWFESLFGWSHSLLSQQRWGMSVKHFNPLSKNTLSLDVKLTTFDLKYRFSRGIWERDETWGLIFGAEDVYISQIHGSFAGIGIFWARSMPKMFDDIANRFPLMNYPKWVDMEMVYYPIPMDEAVEIGEAPTYSVNFHGKVLWSKNIFGEAGFGLKGYSYIRSAINKKNEQMVTINTFYGTMGLGLNF